MPFSQKIRVFANQALPQLEGKKDKNPIAKKVSGKK